MNSYDIGSQPG